MVIAFSPILITIVCCVCCFTQYGLRFGQEARPVILNEPIKPTQQQIINSGGTCAICMMDFSTSDSVIILRCNDKHMFHELCIKGWLNVKNTCPNCRHDLSG